MMALAGALTLLAVRSGRVTSRAVGVSFPHLSIHPGLPLTYPTGTPNIHPIPGGASQRLGQTLSHYCILEQIAPAAWGLFAAPTTSAWSVTLLTAHATRFFAVIRKCDAGSGGCDRRKKPVRGPISLI